MLCSGMKISSIIFIGILTLKVLVQGQEDPENYISIDCGAPRDYLHESYDFYYKTDAGFIDSGEWKLVSPVYMNGMTDPELITLRTFPNGTRNCYTLRPKQGKGNTYLVRASFRYGNYDGKNQSAVFHLYIDNNFWDTVIATSLIWKEVIYAASRDNIQVCLVNIGFGVPFISTLELRLLDNSTYKVPLSGALQSYYRYDVGSSMSKPIIRHPQDDYDRIWNIKDTGFRSVSNTTPIASPTSNNNAYRVPEEVLMTAQQTSSLNVSFKWTWKIDAGGEYYAYFHFAEMLDLNGRVREMDIYLDDKHVDTVSLQNQVPLTVVSMVAPGPRINFKLSATSRSDLPPLLNAIEVFKVLNLTGSQTDLSDFEGMNTIKIAYEIHKQSWQGDPCVPRNMTWEGLNCDYNNSPRIISLNLSSSNLVGTIDASFSRLTAITSLDLSSNQLIGEIPSFLARLSNLRVLNLAGNNLTNSIPEAIKERIDSKTLQLSLDGSAIDRNPTIINAEKRSTNNILPIVAPVSGLALLILLAAIGVFWWRIEKRRQHGASSKRKLKEKNRPFTYNEVVKVTSNFDMIIGEGGFGKVYFGTLNNGDRVAVKMLSLTSKQGYKQFQAEAQLLMVSNHRNLVSLVGYCDDIRNMALIYEYVPAGNLKDHLSGKTPNELSWIQRLHIAVDVAEGLNYLHHGCKPPIVHRDLKSSNILLDENVQAKIADFGLSKAFGNENESKISTCLAGTPGYLDPEFQSTGILSRKSDVYSFGIILFELITGHSAFLRGVNGNTHIVHWVTHFIQRGEIESIMDPRLNGQFNINSAWKVAEVAISCIQATSIQRADISHVLQELRECLNVETLKSHTPFQMATIEIDFDDTPIAQ